MADFHYKGIEVVQQPGAPPFYLTSVAASELLEWCDVPRAKGDFMAGYQRILEGKRVDDLADYLRQSPSNIVPGAVIVAIDSDYVTAIDGGDGLFDITVREDLRDFETKLQELWGSFTTRLSTEELESAGINVMGANPSPSDEAEAFSDSALDQPADDGEVEVTAEDIEGAYPETSSQDDDVEDSELFPRSYLASLAEELSVAVVDLDQLPEERQEAIQSYIEGVSKPGLIIDGQHRVFGAEGVSENDVQLPVVFLPGLAFAEQVFQFYILNSKARPLRPTELRRIVSTSLTNSEIDDLYDRFKRAGIEAEEARWTLEMNTQPASPFQGRIDFGFGAPGAVIPENVADQLVRSFMKMSRRRYRQLIDPLGEEWADVDQRLRMFFWFWSAIKDEYRAAWAEAETQADADQKAQLFLKVALITLQTFVLDRFVTAMPFRNSADHPPFSSEEEMSKMVRSALTYLPAEFFEREWRMKQIDTSEGRKALYAAMEAVVQNQGKVDGRMPLFRSQG